jgi:uncharacterized protein
MKSSSQGLSRRAAIGGLGAVAGFAALGKADLAYGNTPGAGRTPANPSAAEIRDEIVRKVRDTPLVDTHEHLPEERERLSERPPLNRVNDWSILFSHYIDSDLRTAGMSGEDMSRFLGPEVDPADKWKLLAPWWPAARHTGYGQATMLAIEALYGIGDLNAQTIPALQRAFEDSLKPGLYRHVLQEKANILSCQVNSLTDIINESDMPLLLMQDLRIDGFFSWLPIAEYSRRAGVEVRDLGDWHRVIDFFFERYGAYAVGVKSSQAYGRNIDYEPVPAETAAPLFSRLLAGENLNAVERKAMEDHLFWYSVGKADAWELPVKLHTGYYAGNNTMPLSRVAGNAAAAADLCRRSPQTKWVFFHICYPYYEDILAVAKHYPNAWLDMCWSWIINPVASVDFLKKFLMTVPSSKILTFGGDYIPVEPVLGHAMIARRGIALALSQLVEEGWLSAGQALRLTDDIMHGNATALYRLAEKEEFLKRHRF